MDVSMAEMKDVEMGQMMAGSLVLRKVSLLVL